MPTGTPSPPRGIPRRLIGLSSLPKRKIQRIALSIFKTLAVSSKFAMPRFHLIDVASGKRTVMWIRAHREIDIAVNLVCMTLLDKRFDHGDHRVDLLCGFRANRRLANTCRLHIRYEQLRVLLCHLGSTSAFFFRLVYDLVIDIRNVLHESHIKAAPFKVPTDSVKRYEGSRVSDMDAIVDGRATHIHADLSFAYRVEVDFLMLFCVKKTDHFDSLSTVSSRVCTKHRR